MVQSSVEGIENVAVMTWAEANQAYLRTELYRLRLLFRRQVWQPAHTLGLKRVVARERAALFTDLPQMRVEH